MVTTTFHQRPLPDGLVPFASKEGRTLFREALDAGDLEGFFALSEQFHTQADPAFCGLGSLVVVLNALGIDPGRLWKGPWRWFSEELLDCCVPLDHVRQHGLTLSEVGCLARCNGAVVHTFSPSGASVEQFRNHVLASVRSPRSPFIIVSYSRSSLGQSGEGHTSPIGGYHRGRDLVLVLDVARFKYPPHWVPLERLYHAMSTIDVVTGKQRGWLSLEAGPTTASKMFALSARKHIAPILESARVAFENAAGVASSLASALELFVRVFSSVDTVLESRQEEVSPQLLRLRSTALYRELAAAAGPTETFTLDMSCMLLLALPENVWSEVKAREEVLELVRDALCDDELQQEVSSIKQQLEALSRMATCSPATQ